MYGQIRYTSTYLAGDYNVDIRGLSVKFVDNLCNFVI